MIIEKIEYFNNEILINKIRNTKILNSDIEPYKNSDIIISMNNDENSPFLPCQHYCLTDIFSNIFDLFFKIKREFGINILTLNGYIRIHSIDENNEKRVFDFTPPIIEEFNEENIENELLENRHLYDKTEYIFNTFNNGFKKYKSNFIVCDGIHRMMLAMTLGQPYSCVIINNINKEYPYYALPNINRWDGTKMLGQVPELKSEWKRYREPHPQCKRLFRDFNSVFKGVTKERSK